jgi:GWxTD domain-containing protein
MGKRLYFIPLLLLLAFWAVACSIFGNVNIDPFYESFYEKARLIMTDEEIKIYNALDDKESREEFIREFWKIRGPDSDTGENEAKIEFEKRVKFASIRFSWRAVRSRPLTLTPTKSDRGWDTDIGRIYIILGPPDRVFFSDGRILLRDDFEGDFGWRYMHGSEREAWIYDRYQLAISFRGTSFASTASSVSSIPRDPDSVDPESEISSLPSVATGYMGVELRLALESAKLNYISPEFQEDLKRGLRFKANYGNRKIMIWIPAVRINFKEENGKLFAKFRIKINVYKDNKKIESFMQEKSLEETEDDVVKKRDLQLDIAYPLPQKGKYLFDIILEDLTSLTIRKYRNIAKASF